MDELKKAITPKTKALLINNPNNPLGKVLKYHSSCDYYLHVYNRYLHVLSWKRLLSYVSPMTYCVLAMKYMNG